MLFLLLIGISPVKNSIRTELIIGKLLERRARQMQCELTFNPVESNIGFYRVNRFVGLINDKNIPFNVRYFFQLFMLTAEINGTLQVLQANKFNRASHVIAVTLLPQELFSCKDKRLALQVAVAAYKYISRFLAHKGHIIRIPRVRDGRSIRDNQDLFCLDGLAKIIDGKGFTETGFCVP